MKEDKQLKNFLKQNQENQILFLIMGVISFVFLMRSPLHPWNKGNTGVDSSVFKTIAMMMEKGYMPYKDSFDHKGPLLYLLNWVGNKISEYRGVWVIEFVFLTVTLFVMYKIARVVCGRKSALITVFISQTLMFSYYGGGNFTEEYAMMFIAVSIYIFADYFINGNISKRRLILCGLTFACTLLLRPNMIALWCIMCLAVLKKAIENKRSKELGIFIFWFAMGIAIILIPVVIWLATNGALYQCWNDYIIFNSKYISAAGWRFPAKWAAFFTFFNTTVCMTAMVSLLYLCVLNKSIFNKIYLIYMITTLIFISISGRTFEHYGMVLVPAVVYPISLIFREIENHDSRKFSEVVLFVLYVYSMSSIILPEWIEPLKNIPAVYESRNEDHISEKVRIIVEIINNTTDEEEAISVYGNWDIIYVLSNKRHATRYSYQYPIGQVMPKIIDEYMEELQKELPPVIVVDQTYYDNNISRFLDKNQYYLLWSENGESLDGALVYARKKGE